MKREAVIKKNINLEIGERVRLTRVARGFSREELAEYLGISTLFLGYIIPQLSVKRVFF